jgi:hypothetical protein
MSTAVTRWPSLASMIVVLPQPGPNSRTRELGGSAMARRRKPAAMKCSPVVTQLPVVKGKGRSTARSTSKGVSSLPVE